MDTQNALLRAVEIAGSQKSLAALVGVGHQTLWAWISRKNVPMEYCPMIEQATDGQVTCEELRPDLTGRFALLRGTKKQAA
jgi:DNA-binding transcriptional regulator YdaS (Cro superfamily)